MTTLNNKHKNILRSERDLIQDQISACLEFTKDSDTIKRGMKVIEAIDAALRFVEENRITKVYSVQGHNGLSYSDRRQFVTGLFRTREDAEKRVSKCREWRDSETKKVCESDWFYFADGNEELTGCEVHNPDMEWRIVEHDLIESENTDE